MTPILEPFRTYQLDSHGNKALYIYSEGDTHFFIPVNENNPRWVYYISPNGFIGFAIANDDNSYFCKNLKKHNEHFRTI
jgi:hypothetical protein